jgi:hypothetical protein
LYFFLAVLFGVCLPKHFFKINFLHLTTDKLWKMTGSLLTYGSFLFVCCLLCATILI